MNPLMSAMNGNGNKLNTIMSLLRSGNPEQIAMQMMQQNPQFRQFLESNKGKSPEQVARENGIDFSQIKNML